MMKNVFVFAAGLGSADLLCCQDRPESGSGGVRWCSVATVAVGSATGAKRAMC